MNINLTLIGQTIAFAVFVWFCMKFVWPPIMTALAERKKSIADGLSAAERGKKDLEQAGEKVEELIKEAKNQAAGIVANAEKRGNDIVEESKEKAKVEGERIVSAAQGEIEQEVNRARENLRGQLATLTVSGAGKIIKREVDDKAHADLIDELVAQL